MPYTYTFWGITNPSSTHIAYYGDSATETPPDRGSGTEFATSGANNDYTDIAPPNTAPPEDGIRAEQITSAEGRFAYHQFRWMIPPSQPSPPQTASPDRPDAVRQMSITWVGRGRGGSETQGWVYSAKLWVWDPWDGQWVLGDNTTSEGDAHVTIDATGVFTYPNPPGLPAGARGRFMEEIGDPGDGAIVWACAICPIAAVEPPAPAPKTVSQIRTDYVMLRVWGGYGFVM